MENNEAGSSGNADKDPAIIRVLLVDDDPKIIENLLLQCHYQVTTTTQTITALEMLRENRTNYDLIICDVEMPEIDGFELLQIVRREMDIPFIMVSEDDRKELMYEAITLGAVDYLVKPLSVKELKNIWRYAFRRKNLHEKDQSNNLNQDAALIADQNDETNKKGKEVQRDEDNCEGKEESCEEIPTTKRRRLVWTSERHQKFVEAFNQLGDEKAVPKELLRLMDDKTVTRENVASHLQKFREFLRRKKGKESPESNMVTPSAAAGPSGSSTGSPVQVEDRGKLTHAPQEPLNTSFTSYLPDNTIARWNPAQLGTPSLSVLQQDPSVALYNSMYPVGNTLPANHIANILYGNCLTPVEISQMVRILGHHLLPNDVLSRFNLANNFATTNTNASRNSMPSGLTYPLMLNSQESQNLGAFATQPSPNMLPSHQGSLCPGENGSFSFLDPTNYENFQNTAQSQNFATNPFLPNEPLTPNLLPGISESNSISNNNNMPIHLTHPTTLVAPFDALDMNMQGQVDLTSNIAHNTNHMPVPGWEDHVVPYYPGLNNSCNSINTMVSGNEGEAPSQFIQGMDQRETLNATLIGQTNSNVQPNFEEVEDNSALNINIQSNQDYVSQQTNSQNVFVQNNNEPLDRRVDETVQAPNEPAFNNEQFRISPSSSRSSLVE